MKFICILIFLFFLNNCSFDNKTGIWENENSIIGKNDNTSNEFKDFSALSTTIKPFNQTINLKEEFSLNFSLPKKNSNWVDNLYDETNNLPNFKCDNFLQIPKILHYQEILFSIALQYLSYVLSVSRNINPDKPRNIAKVVTVE